MFPLAGAEYPKTSEELAASIQEGLAHVLTFPSGHIAVVIEGGLYPALEKVKVNLSGASVVGAAPPPPPKPQGQREPGPSVGELRVVGKPMTRDVDAPRNPHAISQPLQVIHEFLERPEPTRTTDNPDVKTDIEHLRLSALTLFE